MKSWKIVFIVWVFFWIFFLARGLYKGEFQKFKTLLLAKTPDARRAYVIGEELYNFIEFSLNNTPEEGAYQIRGDFKPIVRYRIIYYLYPRKETDNPKYILCYKADDNLRRRGFYRFATLKGGQFILKKREAY